MADISQMNVNGTTYDIKDTVARASGVPSGGNTNQVLTKFSSGYGWSDVSGGGGVGTVVNLTTTTPSFHNKTVTLTGTYATYTTTFDSSGHASVNVYYVGTYDIACEGFHNSVNVTAMGLVLTQGIDEDYCTVNITTSIADLEGETIDIYYGTDPTDIRAQLTFDNTLALSFRATQIGDYNIAWTTTTTTTTTTFTVSALSGSMNVTFNPIPVGATYTPVNDVLAWVKSGGVLDKNYTTISQVLSDTTTLQTLISSQNANDYLVRSTSWVSNVCGNSTAMSYIGLNNYSANTLLANSTWCTGICNSTYFESVLNVKIPTMTSDTTPSGECFSSPDGWGGAANYPPYKAFDGTTTPDGSTGAPAYGWTFSEQFNSQTTNIYIGYKFTSDVKIYKVWFMNRVSNYPTDTTGHAPKYFKMQASSNNSSWNDVSTVYGITSNAEAFESTFIINNTDTLKRKYQRLIITQCYEANYVGAQEIQFYGRQDV